MIFKSVMWSSMVDYPNNICTTLFVGGCNFNCEYCYNKNLLKEREISFEKDILPKLIDRKDFINHIIISGGECTIYPELEKVVNILYENGFYIGIHTNGYRPDAIKNVINKLDYIGMDIKNDFDNYSDITRTGIDIEKIKKSVKLIISSSINYEFRTTVYPKYINTNNLERIANYLKIMGAKEYVLQNYYDYNGSCNAYSKEELLKMQKQCSKYLPTRLRGIIK